MNSTQNDLYTSTITESMLSQSTAWLEFKERFLKYPNDLVYWPDHLCGEAERHQTWRTASLTTSASLNVGYDVALLLFIVIIERNIVSNHKYEAQLVNTVRNKFGSYSFVFSFSIWGMSSIVSDWNHHIKMAFFNSHVIFISDI